MMADVVPCSKAQSLLGCTVVLWSLANRSTATSRYCSHHSGTLVILLEQMAGDMDTELNQSTLKLDRAHLKCGVNEAHKLLHRAVQGGAGHACRSQQLHSVVPCAAKEDELPPGQDVGSVKEAAHICGGLLCLHNGCAPEPAGPARDAQKPLTGDLMTSEEGGNMGGGLMLPHSGWVSQPAGAVVDTHSQCGF